MDQALRSGWAGTGRTGRRACASLREPAVRRSLRPAHPDHSAVARCRSDFHIIDEAADDRETHLVLAVRVVGFRLIGRRARRRVSRRCATGSRRAGHLVADLDGERTSPPRSATTLTGAVMP